MYDCHLFFDARNEATNKNTSWRRTLTNVDSGHARKRIIFEHGHELSVSCSSVSSGKMDILCCGHDTGYDFCGFLKEQCTVFCFSQSHRVIAQLL